MKLFGNHSKKALVLLAVTALMSPQMVAIASECDKHHSATDKMLRKGEAVVSTVPRADGKKAVKAKILIKAPAHVVWDTVHEERNHDPDLAYSKILERDKNVAMLEQKFALIPVIGTAVCVMKNVEVPFERIDYNMVKSDRFKAMEGSWVLSPGGDENSTYLELSSYLDLGLPIPRPMVEGATAKKLQRRLHNVKKMAEATQSRLAASTPRL